MYIFKRFFSKKKDVSTEKKLQEIEKKYITERNFEGLVRLHDEVMELFDTVEVVLERLPKKAYCLARLGKVNKVEQTLQKFVTYSVLSDEDKMYRSIVLVSLFIEKKPTELGLMELSILKSWLLDPISSEDVMNIVFDFKDFLGDVDVFDKSVLGIRNNTFDEKLLFSTFFSMLRDEDSEFYYNREKNDVEDYVDGYLSSMTDTDQSSINKSFSSKILESQPHDRIIEGVHFLIPQLSLSELIWNLKQEGQGEKEFILWLIGFEGSVIEGELERGGFDSKTEVTELIVLDDRLTNFFYNSLDTWVKKNPSKFDFIKNVLETTQKKIALKWLKQVNDIGY